VLREVNHYALDQCGHSTPFPLTTINYVSAYLPHIVISDVGSVNPHQLS